VIASVAFFPGAARSHGRPNRPSSLLAEPGQDLGAWELLPLLESVSPAKAATALVHTQMKGASSGTVFNAVSTTPQTDVATCSATTIEIAEKPFKTPSRARC
jgi:hypothetical protein